MRTWKAAASPSSASDLRVRVVEHDEVDIARIVELVGAHLAHRQHDVARAVFRLRGIARLEAAAARGVAQQKADRCADRGIRQFGQRAGGAHHRPGAADVGERDQQRRLGLQLAQERASPRPRSSSPAPRVRPGEAARRDARPGSASRIRTSRAGSAAIRSQRYGEPSAMPVSSASTLGEAAIRRLTDLPASLRPMSASHAWQTRAAPPCGANSRGAATTWPARVAARSCRRASSCDSPHVSCGRGSAAGRRKGRPDFNRPASAVAGRRAAAPARP